MLKSSQPEFSEQVRVALRKQQLTMEALPEAKLLAGLVNASQGHVVVAELSHYIRLSKTSPAEFERLRLLIDFVHATTRDN
jgi:hypothetical protein